MRGFFLTICFLFPSLAALAQSPRDAQAVAIGPWLIEATYRNGKFERCGMSRTTVFLTTLEPWRWPPRPSRF